MEGSIRAVCPQCEEPRLNVIANTETKKVLLKCLCCDYEENIERATFVLSKKGCLDMLDQVDRMIESKLPPGKENPFWLGALSDNSHEYLDDLIEDPEAFISDE